MPNTPVNDHELLVRIDEKLGSLTAAFAELKESVKAKADASRVDRLEARTDSQDKRLDGLDKKLAMLAGGVAVVEFVVRLLWK